MRYLTSEMKRLLAEEKKMAFIADPRQVGKITLAKSLLPSSPGGYFNWDIWEDQKALLRIPPFFGSGLLLGRTKNRPLFLPKFTSIPAFKGTC